MMMWDRVWDCVNDSVTNQSAVGSRESERRSVHLAELAMRVLWVFFGHLASVGSRWRGFGSHYYVTVSRATDVSSVTTTTAPPPFLVLEMPTPELGSSSGRTRLPTFRRVRKLMEVLTSRTPTITNKLLIIKRKKKNNTARRRESSSTTIDTNRSSTSQTKSQSKNNNGKRMQRVSSRQRLHSFDDGFEGRVTTSSDNEDRVINVIHDDDDDGDDFLDAVQDDDNDDDIVPFGFKRKRSSASLAKLHVIPLDTSTTQSTTTLQDKPNHFGILPPDLTLQMMRYCDKETLRALMVVDRRTHQILSSHDAMLDIWKPLAVRTFGYNSIIDYDRLVLSSPADLLRCDAASTPLPSVLDGAKIVQVQLQQQNHATQRQQQHRHMPPTPTTDNNMVVLSQSDPYTVQFHGAVGRGDRCVRANHPFPTTRRPVVAAATGTTTKATTTATTPLTELFRRRQRRSSGNHDAPVFPKLRLVPPKRPQPTTVQPFLMPVTNPETGKIQLFPTKRSYYEVTILPKPDQDKAHAGNAASATTTTTTNNNNNDCVAVGLARAEFRLVGRQPGWDALSYGLHGDDGGLFHNNGQMLRPYLQPQHDHPKFQPGDTVGCGIDYEQNVIFYTINGQYTGPAFTLTDAQLTDEVWYPTVGIDTNHPLRFNFGQEVFQYRAFYRTNEW